jgi:hypothetical protein
MMSLPNRTVLSLRTTRRYLKQKSSSRLAVVLGQHLGQVLVIEALVLVSGQLYHSGRDGSLYGVVGRSAPVAMGQGRRPFFRVGLMQALQLSLRDPQKFGGLGVDKRPRRKVAEDDDSALLSCVQDDPAIHEATESLFASGVTDSLYSHIKSR